MKKYLSFVMALLVPIFIAGCVASGTIIIVFDIVEFVSSSTGMHVEEINLTENSDYQDNKGKIKSIDQVTVAGTLTNLEPADNQAEIWLAYTGSYATPAEVRSNATRIFVSPVIPGGQELLINWADGLNHIENLDALKDAADEGLFWLYGLAADSPFTVQFNITLIITMTAGL